MSSRGWIGVDLDGTLAHYEGWVGPEHIGDPIPLMLLRVKRMLEAGEDVRIFTARVYSDGSEDGNRRAFICQLAIKRWCMLHLGCELPVTCMKDYSMKELWDDRVVQIEINTGKRLDGSDICGMCLGAGELLLPESNLTGVTEDCRDCNGIGRLP